MNHEIKLGEFLDNIYLEHSETINQLKNNANGTQLIFDGFLSSDAYAMLVPKEKMEVLELLRRTQTLIADLEYFQQENNLGIYQ